MSHDQTECAHACAECAEICLETLPRLLHSEARRAKELAALLHVTAESCRAAQTALLLGSDVHRYLCLAVAAICDRCSADAEALRENALQDAIDACIDCAEHCRRMAADTGNAALSA